jgi:hypothetical protein
MKHGCHWWVPRAGFCSLATSASAYNLLEKHALEIHSVREFVFTSGNLSGQDMAAALELALNKMRSFCRRNKPPFVASITRTGEVYLRWPKN